MESTLNVNWNKIIQSSILAGIAISIGCVAYLSTGYAWLFPIGLFIVCFYGLHLYTGRICWAKPYEWLVLGTVYIWNTIAAYIMGIIMYYTKPGLVEKAETLVMNKISEELAIVPLAILCNILIYVAVDSYKKTRHWLGLIFATTIFVACGFEHCIANAFYFGIGHNVCNIWQTISFLVFNAFWNSVGGLLAYHLTKNNQ